MRPELVFGILVVIAFGSQSVFAENPQANGAATGVASAARGSGRVTLNFTPPAQSTTTDCSSSPRDCYSVQVCVKNLKPCPQHYRRVLAVASAGTPAAAPSGGPPPAGESAAETGGSPPAPQSALGTSGTSGTPSNSEGDLTRNPSATNTNSQGEATPANGISQLANLFEQIASQISDSRKGGSTTTTATSSLTSNSSSKKWSKTGITTKSTKGW